VFRHPALEGLENVTQFAKDSILDRSRLAKLATQYGVDKVVRWKPKKSDNLQGSGIDTVLAHTMYSIIGALALQRGGEVAAKTVRERILKPLGLK
jgi:large subunit ribosomal protein L15